MLYMVYNNQNVNEIKVAGLVLGRLEDGSVVEVGRFTSKNFKTAIIIQAQKRNMKVTESGNDLLLEIEA